MAILNLTGTPATPELKAAGVIDPGAISAAYLKDYLTFETMPDQAQLLYRARKIADIALACEVDKALLNGIPAFMLGILENALIYHDIAPVYSFEIDGAFVGFVEIFD